MGVEVVGFRLDLQGWEAAGKAAHDTYELKDAAYELAGVYAKLDTIQTEVAQHMAQQADSARTAGRALAQLEETGAAVARAGTRAATETHQLNTAMRGVATGGTKDMGMAMLQASYFVDDLQYGMRGIVNNIPILLTSFGVGAGLAGVVSIAAVGIGILTQHLGDLANWFTGSTANISPFTTSLEKATAELKKLGKEIEDFESKPGLTKREFARLERDRDRRDTLERDVDDANSADSMKKARRFDDKEAGEGFRSAIDTVGGPKLLEEVRRAFMLTSDSKGRVVSDLTGRNLDHRKAADEALAEAQRGSVAAVEAIVARMKQAFGGNNDVVRAIASNTPEAIAEWEKVTDEAVNSGKAAHEALAEKDKEEKRLAREANEEAVERARREEELDKEMEEVRKKRKAEEADALTLQGQMNEKDVDLDEIRRLNAKKQATKAVKKMQAAQRQYALASMTPMQRRFAQQMERMQGRFNRKGTGAAIAQRQMMLRMGGGANNMKAAAEKRERAQIDFAKASKDFASAVETLQRDGITVVL